jgi:hypothetical protein
VSAAGPADKKGSDLVKLYVILFAVFSAALGVFLVKMTAKKNAFREARIDARRLLTIAGPGARPRGGPPTTIVDTGLDILKYLETYQSAQLKSGEGSILPMKDIQDRIQGANLTFQNATGLDPVTNAAKKYVQYSSTITLREAHNLENFATLLFNIEATSTSIRVLELNWSLKPEKDNPYPPGNAIASPTFRLGVRRPLGSEGTGR